MLCPQIWCVSIFRVFHCSVSVPDSNLEFRWIRGWEMQSRACGQEWPPWTMVCELNQHIAGVSSCLFCGGAFWVNLLTVQQNFKSRFCYLRWGLEFTDPTPQHIISDHVIICCRTLWAMSLWSMTWNVARGWMKVVNAGHTFSKLSFLPQQFHFSTCIVSSSKAFDMSNSKGFFHTCIPSQNPWCDCRP